MIDVNKIARIKINKNRGWRGLAELTCLDETGETVHKMIFSFSQAVWEDMLKGSIAIQDENNYYILSFDNLHRLPRRDQQRSVLIKNFTATVISILIYSKHEAIPIMSRAYSIIEHFKKNKNNHTTSDWNCIGVRVMPSI